MLHSWSLCWGQRPYRGMGIYTNIGVWGVGLFYLGGISVIWVMAE